LPYHHIKAPSQRELSPKVTEGVTQNIPASMPFSSIPAFQGSAVPLLPSRLTPCHLPLRGRLLPHHHIKAPSQRELSPKVTEGVTQNIPASVPFSSVPALPVSTTPSVTATPCHLPQGGRLLPYHHIKAPSQRELSPKVTEGVTQNIPASVPFSSIPAFQGSAVRSASAGLHALQRQQIRFAPKAGGLELLRL